MVSVLTQARQQRVHRLATLIANQPGLRRKEIAQQWSLSERQVQNDLDLLRAELNLPLVRRDGYRIEPTTWRLDCSACGTLPVTISTTHPAMVPAYCPMCGARSIRCYHVGSGRACSAPQ